MTSDIQVEPTHYSTLTYDTKERFLSYWHQISEVLTRQPEQMLEVGIGNGFVHRYLRQHDVDVHTMDFDERLGPDTTGSVLEMPFEDDSFDMVACFETLEHLPFEVFETALSELRRVGRRWVLLSLPDVTPYVRMDFKVEGVMSKKGRLLKDLPDASPRPHKFDGQHYWELGKKDYAVREISKLIEDAGLEIEASFRVFELPYHRFISCRIR